jgi:hypothetical protein
MTETARFLSSYAAPHKVSESLRRSAGQVSVVAWLVPGSLYYIAWPTFNSAVSSCGNVHRPTDRVVSGFLQHHEHYCFGTCNARHLYIQFHIWALCSMIVDCECHVVLTWCMQTTLETGQSRPCYAHQLVIIFGTISFGMTCNFVLSTIMVALIKKKRKRELRWLIRVL